MPKHVERKLRMQARKKFPGDKEKQDTYVYGTMEKLGLMPKKKEEAK